MVPLALILEPKNLAFVRLYVCWGIDFSKGYLEDEQLGIYLFILFFYTHTIAKSIFSQD